VVSFTVLSIEAGRGQGKHNVIGAILERDYPQLTPGTGDAGGGAREHRGYGAAQQ